MRSFVLLLLVSAIGACGAARVAAKPPSPPDGKAEDAPRDYWAEAQEASAKNDFIGAYALAQRVPQSSPDAAQAKAMMKEIQPRVDRLVAGLTQKADDAATLGFAARALHIYGELLDHAPLPPAERGALEKKQKAQREQLATLKNEYDDKLRFARAALSRGDALDAYRALSRAYYIAEEQDFAWTLVEEQALELARSDLPPAQGVAVQKQVKKRRRATLMMPREEDAIIGNVDTFAQTEQEISRLKSVRDLVERARDYKKHGRLYEALVALDESRRKEPDSVAVRLLVESLEEERLRLIDEYTEIAERHLAKQNLEAALPYFHRVLKLEPDNLRAQEAVQMFKNLEKIRQERSGVR